MEKEQAKEWAEAQAITFSVDLVEAAKKHLNFLATVERNRDLYEEHVLKRAIYRYNAFWLPLLAKHLENPVTEEEPLVVPLDCEWIWHCHRLNPLRYKFDCEKLFGRILGNQNVISSVQATSKSKTEEIWNRMYPEEPYELDMTKPFSVKKGSENAKFTSYDLVAAVKRQVSFAYQMSRPYAADDLYLQEAVRRYKGFLHMIRTNDQKKRQCFCVPTYDIDLMWHTHQLHPDSYCKDLTETVGRVCHHNDTVSDRSPGKELQTGFSEITKLWEESYGKSYWTAGTLHRGDSPTPVTKFPVNFIGDIGDKKLSSLNNCGNPIQFPSMKVVEVHLEFVEVKNLPEEHKGNLVVRFSKKQTDKLFNGKRSISISTESGEKEVASFQCEPTGEFLFELMSNAPGSDKLKLLASYSLSLQELVASGSQLSADMWLSPEPVSNNITISEPILVYTSISFTPPIPAPQVFRLVRSQSFPKGEDAKILTKVLDQDGKQVCTLDIRNIEKDITKGTPELMKEVYCITDAGETRQLAEFVGNHCSVKGSNGSFKLQNSSGNDDSLFELVGHKMVKIFPGRRLDFETVPMEQQTLGEGFMTMVEFSMENPYGKAVALIDFKSQTIKAMEEWVILPGITMAFLLSDIMKEVVNGKTRMVKNEKKVKNGVVVTSGIPPCGDCGSGCAHLGTMVKKDAFADCAKCFSCGVLAGDCGSGCAHLGTMVKKDAFADCAKCFSCGVLAGDENGGMVKKVGLAGDENGGIPPCGECGSGCAHLENTVKKVGLAQCYLCFSPLGTEKNSGMVKNVVTTGETTVKKVGLAQCHSCFSPLGADENGGMVKNVVTAGEIGNMVENGVIINYVEASGYDSGCAHLENKVKKVGAECYMCCCPPDADGNGGMVKDVVTASETGNMVENGVITNYADGSGYDSGCAHLENTVKKVGAQCYMCCCPPDADGNGGMVNDVVTASETGNMVENGVITNYADGSGYDSGCAHLENTVKKVGAQCYMCCCPPDADGNGDMVKDGVTANETGNMVKNGVITNYADGSGYDSGSAHLENTVKKVGAACSICFCLLPADENGALVKNVVMVDGEYRGKVSDGAINDGVGIGVGAIVEGVGARCYS